MDSVAKGIGKREMFSLSLDWICQIMPMCRSHLECLSGLLAFVCNLIWAASALKSFLLDIWEKQARRTELDEEACDISLPALQNTCKILKQPHEATELRLLTCVSWCIKTCRASLDPTFYHLSISKVVSIRTHLLKSFADIDLFYLARYMYMGGQSYQVWSLLWSHFHLKNSH